MERKTNVDVNYGSIAAPLRAKRDDAPGETHGPAFSLPPLSFPFAKGSSETGTFFTQSSATVQGRRHRYCRVSVPVHNHLTEETVRPNKQMARDCWYKKERKKFF
ncbi:hypothetical protein TNCT_115651 [Trichonephila clavata]|uniref:Uncharacterized protein n=1 Tax=Trichonephila clavata TaxID=2740835 RepID=A0A8X6L8I3_TRICU|nr:hypothetical protein TNCT_115651 [Trichonephila clavata]